MKELDSKEGEKVFIIILLLYILLELLVSLFTQSLTISLTIKFVAIGFLLIIYRRWFSFNLRFDFLGILSGILIALIWIGIDGFYPHLTSNLILSYQTIDIILKLLIGIIIAPLIEEFFTRFFLHRFIMEKDWLKQKLGNYSLVPFIVTVLFFGFSHGRWFAGIIAGIILNLVWYKRKDMNSVVVSHAVANLVIGIFVVVFGMWQFW